MYSKIINPETNRKVSINSKLGRKILTNYWSILKGGASTRSRVVDRLLKYGNTIY